MPARPPAGGGFVVEPARPVGGGFVVEPARAPSGGGFVVPVRPYTGGDIFPTDGGFVVDLLRASPIGGGFVVPVERAPMGGGFVVPLGRAPIGGGFVVPVGRANAVGEMGLLVAPLPAVAWATGTALAVVSGAVSTFDACATGAAGAGPGSPMPGAVELGGPGGAGSGPASPRPGLVVRNGSDAGAGALAPQPSSTDEDAGGDACGNSDGAAPGDAGLIGAASGLVSTVKPPGGMISVSSVPEKSPSAAGGGVGGRGGVTGATDG